MSAMRRNYVAGTWVPSASDEAVDVINPATEEVIDQVPAGHPADVDAAVEAGPVCQTGPRARIHRVGSRRV
jgi:aldehyde dehydrogenase (NAD+)